MPTVLIVGATRGLGLSLAKQYASSGNTVYGTARSGPPPQLSEDVKWIKNIDVSEEAAGASIANALPSGTKVDVLIITAGFFTLESFDEPKFDDEVAMYKTCAIGPLFVVQRLVKEGRLGSGAKVFLLSSEAGSIALRGEKADGGGLYGHHASKAALNMVGKLLSNDLREKKIAVGLIHPGFMRTELTKSVGFDEAWDKGGAVHPDEAATSLIDFIKTFDMSKTGTFYAPRGADDIGTAEDVLGAKDKLPKPLELPW